MVEGTEQSAGVSSFKLIKQFSSSQGCGFGFAWIRNYLYFPSWIRIQEGKIEKKPVTTEKCKEIGYNCNFNKKI